MSVLVFFAYFTSFLVAVAWGEHLDFCDVNQCLISIYVGLNWHVVPFVTLQCLRIV
jgi:hypothetical protein